VKKRTTPRRGRPRNLQRREQIQEAALVLLGAHGYGGTTMSQVARESGISTSLLFRYYPTKETLMEAVLARSEAPLKTLLAGIDDAATENKTCRAFLYGVALRYAEYVRLTHNHWVLWLEHKEWMPAHTKDILERLDQIVAAKLPRMPDYRPREHAYVIIRAFLGAVFSLALLGQRIGRDAPKGFSPQEYFRSIATSIGGFLATRQPGPPTE
jgi:AcrR family transcriptional regulator